MTRLALVFALLTAVACKTTPPPTPVTPTGESDAAACLKMCEVAGDAEHDTSAVAACQEKCKAR